MLNVLANSYTNYQSVFRNIRFIFYFYIKGKDKPSNLQGKQLTFCGICLTVENVPSLLIALVVLDIFFHYVMLTAIIQFLIS